MLGLIVKLSVDRALVPKQLVAVILNVYIPGVLAVPFNIPFNLSNVIPGGNTSSSQVPLNDDVPIPDRRSGYALWLMSFICSRVAPPNATNAA